jgi:hypothetical protein
MSTFSDTLCARRVSRSTQLQLNNNKNKLEAKTKTNTNPAVMDTIDHLARLHSNAGDIDRAIMVSQSSRCFVSVSLLRTVVYCSMGSTFHPNSQKRSQLHHVLHILPTNVSCWVSLRSFSFSHMIYSSTSRITPPMCSFLAALTLIARRASTSNANLHICMNDNNRNNNNSRTKLNFAGDTPKQMHACMGRDKITNKNR